MATQAKSIERLWSWWRKRGAEGIASAIDAGEDLAPLAAKLSKLLAAVSPDLEWELSEGSASSEYLLTITSGGIAGGRKLANTVVGAAPPADALWRYSPFRERVPEPKDRSIDIGTGELALADMRVALRPDAETLKVDVVIGHPAFAGLPEDQRGRVAFLALDWTLGEDDVERWVGAIELTPGVPDGGLPLGQARDALDDFAAAHPKSP